jgi:hypothetical protein
MFGLSKKEPKSDTLSVQVHAVANKEAYALAQRIWNENVRTLHVDQATRKEFLHFGYANPKCVIWLQRDQNRSNPFELIVRWEGDTHEVCVISDASGEESGDATRPKAILNSMLTTPSVVLSTGQ